MAVIELSDEGISVSCRVLDPYVGTYAFEIFCHRWRVLDRMAQLPARSLRLMR